LRCPPLWCYDDDMPSITRFLRNRYLAARLLLGDPSGYRTLTRIRRDRLTFLGKAALVELYETVRQVEQAQLPGVLVEMGCALGGSALAIAQAKTQTRSLFLFDVFDMIPPPSPRDGADAHARYAEITAGRADGIEGKEYYGYQTDLLDRVIETFHGYGFAPKPHQIHFVQGTYETTLAHYLNEPVALAHIDCDWYDSVTVCLEEIAPRLVVGGTLVIDDYFEWSGCRQAVDDYFADKQDQFIFRTRSRLHITRRADPTSD